MIHLPLWLEITAYFTMVGLFATIIKFLYELYNILKKP